MTLSRNGQWVSDDPRYMYITENRTATIHRIKRYHNGFNSVSIIYEIDDDGKESESTIPRYHFKKITKPDLASAMLDIVRYYTYREILDVNISQRVFEYKTYLFNHKPEKLV